MRYVILFLAAALLAGCSTKGPGADCDDCAVAEAKPVGDNAQAAAASAAGGQRANQAPFSGEQGARIDPNTTVGRGAGDTTASTADTESRLTASGGAQNIALKADADANARNEGAGGGVSVSVQEARKDATQWRALLTLEATKEHPDQARLAFYRTALTEARADINAAEAAAAATRPSVTHNYGGYMSGDNTLIGYSRAGNGEGPDSAEATKALGEAAAQALARDKRARAAKAALAANTRAPAAPEALSASGSDVERWRSELAEAKALRAHAVDGSSKAADLDAKIRTLIRWISQESGAAGEGGE